MLPRMTFTIPCLAMTGWETKDAQQHLPAMSREVDNSKWQVTLLLFCIIWQNSGFNRNDLESHCIMIDP